MQDLKLETLRLAGFAAGHALWSICDGATLIPLGFALSPDGSRELRRFFDEELGEAAKMGQAWLAENRDKACSAVLALDSYVTFAERLDAIVIAVQSYEDPRFSLDIAVPYRPAKPARLFGLLGKKRPIVIYRPRFMNMEGLDETDHDRLGEAFFSGIDQHEKAKELWDLHCDPTK